MLRYILAYATFPGIIAHEFAHAWACRRMGICVHKVCYLRLGNPMGYVLHEPAEHSLQHIVVAVAPFFVSTFLALSGSLAACWIAKSQIFPELRDGATLTALWLSFSWALHAFPSGGDADSLWKDVGNPEVTLLGKLLLIPAVGVIRMVQVGSRFWLDILFALAVVAMPPTMLLVFTPQ